MIPWLIYTLSVLLKKGYEKTLCTINERSHYSNMPFLKNQLFLSF